MVGKIYLAKTNKDLIEGKIQKKSMIITPKNFTIHKSILIKYIGKINIEKYSCIMKSFCKELGCNESFI